MTNPASRFQVVDSLVRAPGETLITKSTQGPFIDTGLSYGLDDRPWFRGRVYLSKDEVREMAEELGLFDALQDEVTAALLKLPEAIGTANEMLQRSWDEGYAAGRAENLDHLADELVDRMRDRVARPRARRAAEPVGDADAGADDSAAAAAPAPVADAPVVEDPAGVRGSDGGDDSGAGAGTPAD